METQQKKPRRTRRGPLSGAAVAAKNAPHACKVELSHCMKGRKSKAAAGACMRNYNRCFRGKRW